MNTNARIAELESVLRLAVHSASPIPAPLGAPLSEHVDTFPAWVAVARAALGDTPATKGQDALQANGWRITNTGGGCTAWQRELVGGGYVWITCADDPSHAFSDDEAVAIGIYDDEANVIAFAECAQITIAD